MTTTPHGQVPEALRTITRYEVVDCIDSKHVPAVIPNKDGPWVRYEDHVAALVEAQQPATHVQNPAEIEHVAGDVSKNGPESNMAPQPSPTPQADSQSAPTNTRQIAECYGDCPTDPKTCANPCKFEGRAARAPADSGAAPAGGEIDRLRAALVYVAFALHGTPQHMLAEGITLIDGDTVRVSRDGWTVEASVNPARATPPAQAAESVPAPAGPSKPLPYEPTSAMLIAAREQDPALPIEMVRAIYWAMWRKAPTPPDRTPVESVPVLPDFDTVEQHIYGACRRYITQDMLEPIHNLIRDAIDAARKQGGA